ncbi:MAG: GtrA family protein [Candidatus Nomurabacteria bacterium]|jgi:putative flippase GtrA|nr:GtrA family protein [Candidatus Nomurabacteria bacterium]
MIKKSLALYRKHRMALRYVVFGVLTTVVSIASYLLFARVLHVEEVTSNILSWVCAVAFAYVTNKVFVFESKKTEVKEVAKEVTTFFGMRLVSGVFDIAMFALLVKVLLLNDLIVKVVLQVIIVVLNYLFSKKVIFKKD